MNKKMLLRVGCPVLFFAICGFVLYPVFERAQRNQRHFSCQSNLKQIGLSAAQYVQDYDGKYPPVMTGSRDYGWAGILQAYLKSTLILRCPDLARDNNKAVSPRSIGYTDYWYNERLQRVADKNIHDITMTILSGDGNDGHDGTTARYSLSSLPSEWLGDKNSPAYRHPRLGQKGANYIFTDGHAEWYQPEKIKTSMEKGSPTFAVR